MIKIGDFSNLAHVSVKTLHHYDELGLLKPVHIDRFSGYRYYSLQQLTILNRILALKDLGLSLEQVAQLLGDKHISTAEMRGMLRLKRMELAARVDEEQAPLLRVEQRLRQLEEQDSPQAEIAVKTVPAQTVLLAQITAADDSMLLRARESLQTLLQQHLEQARLKPAGPWLGLVENLPYADTDQQVTLAVPVQLRPNQHADDWRGTPIHLRELPAAANMASIVHNGESTRLPLTYTSLYSWTQSNGYKPAGPFREVYLPNLPSPSPDAALIEVQCPVERAGIPLSIQPRKEINMKPEIVTLPAFKAAGYSYIGKNENAEISQMWDRFLPRIDEPKRTDAHTSYGLCLMNNPEAKEGEFEYVASVEVADGQNLPQGMVYREVPAHKYAVFTHHGKLDNLRDTFDYIFSTGLSQAGLQAHASGFDMEVYKDDFEFGADTSKMYIYVALQ